MQQRLDCRRNPGPSAGRRSAALFARSRASSVAAVRDHGTNNLPKIDNHGYPPIAPRSAIASKNWVYRQYDHTVRQYNRKTGVGRCRFFVRYANKILAATTDCNSFYCALDPREGGKIAVAEAARNLTCSGARPLAVTDNLNFGNP